MQMAKRKTIKRQTFYNNNTQHRKLNNIKQHEPYHENWGELRCYRFNSGSKGFEKSTGHLVR